MRFLIASLISFQFISSPVLANVGQKEEFSAKAHLHKVVSENEARHFEKGMREMLVEISQKSPLKLAQELNPYLPDSEKQVLQALFKKTSVLPPKFKEVKAGHWELRSEGHKIAFSLLDLHQGQMWVNGRKFKFQGTTFANLEESLKGFELPAKTTMLELIFQKTLGIESAHALGLILVVAAIIAVVIVGYSIWQFRTNPEKTVKKINEMKDQLEKDAATCQEAPSNRTKYEETFYMAYSISERASYNTTSSSEALQYALKDQLNSGARNDQDCFKLMSEVGNKLDLKIPVPTDRQMQLRELGGGAKINAATDVTSAVFNLCQAYNALGSCMETFVAEHVDNSGIDSFKDSATQNFPRYKSRSGRSKSQ